MADKYFDYFTAAEAEQFSFYRIPKALFTEKDFEELSCEAKVLYGMMLDRMGLSIRNQWFDSLGRAYIIFTVEDVMEVMGCRSQKAVRLMKELDTADGIGLIEKKRIGLGRPNLIYVKNFMVCGNSGSDPQEDSCSRFDKKEAGMSFDTGDLQKRETVHADTGCMGNMAVMGNDHDCRDENGQMCGKIVLKYADSLEKITDTQDGYGRDLDADAAWDNNMQCSGGNVPDGMKTETVEPQTAFSGKFYIRSSMEKMDKYNQTESTAAENQNSDCSAYFSEDAAAMEKEYGFADQCFSVEGETEASEMAAFRPAGGKSGNAGENERAFADKAVESMVKELLWQEEETAVGSGPEQVLQTDTRQEFPKPQEMNFEKQDSVIVDVGVQESWNAKCNETEYSNTEYNEKKYGETEKNETDFSVAHQSYQSCQSDPADRQNSREFDTDKNRETDSMEGKMDAYREKIRENISYSCFHSQETENVDELVELMVDAMMVPDEHTIRIAGTEKPASVVKGRFMKLMYSHIEYVLECLNKYTGKIRNIKAYLLTTLYNSSLTISSYYRAEVNHDLYGYQSVYTHTVPQNCLTVS